MLASHPRIPPARRAAGSCCWSPSQIPGRGQDTQQLSLLRSSGKVRTLPPKFTSPGSTRRGGERAPGGVLPAQEHPAPTLQVLDLTLRNTTQAPQVQIPTRTAGLESLILSRRRKRFLMMEEFGQRLYIYYVIGPHMLLNICKLPFPPLGEGSWGQKQECLQEKH